MGSKMQVFANEYMEKITIANFIGRTPVFPGGQGLKTSEKNKEKKKRKN